VQVTPENPEQANASSSPAVAALIYSALPTLETFRLFLLISAVGDNFRDEGIEVRLATHLNTGTQRIPENFEFEDHILPPKLQP
jgi:hypothetical protein